MLAKDILASHIAWDNHGCMPLRPLDESFLPQLGRYKEAGFTLITLNIGFDETSMEEHFRMAASFRSWIARHSDRYMMIRTVEDVRVAKSTGRLGICFDIEGANAIGDQLSLIELYYDLGVRWMLFAYNKNNRTGGGCQDDDGGLTPFGKAMIDEMKRVGMMICCSHTGERTSREAMDYAACPVIFSHSNARAVHDHPRNIDDGLIRACAATGGVVGLNGVGIFLGQNDNSPDQVIRHIDHISELVGPEHVGFGFDFVFDTKELDEYVAKHRNTFPPELGYAERVNFVAPEALEPIVEGLIVRGYCEETIAKIIGGNLLRVAAQVWQ